MIFANVLYCMLVYVLCTEETSFDKEEIRQKIQLHGGTVLDKIELESVSSFLFVEQEVTCIEKNRKSLELRLQLKEVYYYANFQCVAEHLFNLYVTDACR